MKIDLYTKIVLTFIAIFLGIIALKDVNWVGTAKADSPAPFPVPKSSESEVIIGKTKCTF